MHEESVFDSYRSKQIKRNPCGIHINAMISEAGSPYSEKLGGCPFNGPLSGTKYLTRAASPIQNASTPKSSLPFSKHRSCALLCTVVRRF